jgi:hypothetical protein
MRLFPHIHIGSRALHAGGSFAQGVAYLLVGLLFLTIIAETYFTVLRAISDP